MRTRRTAATADPEVKPEQPVDDDQESSDEDDAPEEVSLAASKQTAATLRREQQQARQETQRQAKEQRRKQQAAHEAQLDQAASPHPQQIQDSHGGDQAAEDAELDLLPDYVIAAMAEQPRQTKQQQQQAVVTAQLRSLQQGGLKRKQALPTERQIGPLKVQVLSAVGGDKVSEAAKAFLQQRLQSRKRSNDMLRPAKQLNALSYQPA